MPIKLNISKWIFPNIPQTFGRQKALNTLITLLKTSWEAEIRQDIKAVMATFTLLPKPDQDQVLDTLAELLNAVLTLPDSDPKRIFSKYIRLFSLMLSRYGGTNNAKLPLLIKQITSFLGEVPQLNHKVALPSSELPPNIGKSIGKWKTISWKNPSRSSSSECIGFFTVKSVDGKQISSVRKVLLKEDTYHDKHSSNVSTTSAVSPPSEALSFADADFYAHGDLQADHLQPSEDILLRQLELIEAMNFDQNFGKEIYESSLNDGYFIYDKMTNSYSGTKYFFMLYHNCIDNLWLISTAENTGQGKSNIDPIVWLRAHDYYGEAFFNKIEAEGGLNIDTILYTVGTGKSLLASYAKSWFKNQHKALITASGYIEHHVNRPFKEQVSALRQQSVFASSATASTASSKKRSVDVMMGMTLAKSLAERGTSPDSSSDPVSTSAESDAVEINDDNISAIAQYTKKDEPTISGIIKQRRKEYIRDNKKPKISTSQTTQLSKKPPL